MWVCPCIRAATISASPGLFCWCLQCSWNFCGKFVGLRVVDSSRPDWLRVCFFICDTTPISEGPLPPLRGFEFQWAPLTRMIKWDLVMHLRSAANVCINCSFILWGALRLPVLAMPFHCSWQFKKGVLPAFLRSQIASGWPEPYIYTVYDRIFGDFSTGEKTWFKIYVTGTLFRMRNTFFWTVRILLTFTRASWKDSWVSGKVLILTACSAKQVRCPFISIGSDASYDFGTVCSLRTILFLRKLCGLTFLLQIECYMDLPGSARNPRFPCVSAVFECHTISQIYQSETVRAQFACTYHRELEKAWQFDTTW